MKKLLAFIGGAVVVVLGIITVSYLQHRFDQSDMRHAVQAVLSARPGGPRDVSLVERISTVYEVSPEQIQWNPKIESKTKGTVLVEAVLPKDSPDLIWQVDLVRFNVVPISPAARALGKLKPLYTNPPPDESSENK